MRHCTPDAAHDLTALLPATSDVPVGLVQIDEGCRSLERVAAGFPSSEEVTERLANCTEEHGEVRLVKGWYGDCNLLFGRDRTFVEEQITRFSS